MKSWLQLLLAGIISLWLAACASPAQQAGIKPNTRPVDASTNACTLFKQNPTWYWEALDTYYHWGVPISVQMAIIQRESDFQAGARPPKKQLFGFIPWGNISSAYGYAQALSGTWADYQRETKKNHSARDQFGDASDFIGWYCNKANKTLGIPLNNAYKLYLAYHEGLNGYAEKTYLDKPWLLQVAETVQQRANQYRLQIAQCKYSLPKASLAK